MRVFVTKRFGRFQRKEKISDVVLNEAIARAERGQIDATLGRHLIKQRIGRTGQGRSGGYRTVVAYRMGDRAVFLFGFAKNERDNIAPDELEDLRLVAQGWLEAPTGKIEASLKDGAIEELKHGEESGEPLARGS